MTKAFTYSLLLIAATLLVLLLRIPLEELSLSMLGRPFMSEMILGSALRILIIIGLSIFIVQKKLLPFNGLQPFSFSNPLLLLLAVAVILFLSYSSYEFYLAAAPSMVLLFGVAQALVGILEELLFRGIVFPLMILHYANKKQPISKAIWVSSLLFGAVHLVGLIRHPENFWSVINTIIFAIGIGFFFACLLLKTKNILVPIFLHFLVDFTNGASALSGVEAVSSNPTTTTIVLTLAVVTGMSFLILGAGWLLMKRVPKEVWMQKAALVKL
ncbi:CPBP family intramembrane glutamic endopeptidase [Pontibacter akesuensis]|uniref:CAAX prenyl protease 2/Lysostaphin resistance protein A-like domain-containing protein n=1 Tax=Pontibacter akesuensis TaxID=388950 RepID=A0A1I7GK64_9BACT|nr:CPBP family intramembrane glutamic endopeptidase [Pontibacter akesuensis]GHA56346.1 hypothetical protein GCM10007389_04920 [Pontibacter akesuensis]SFU48824.1 hypothetical protein SAMN04487941_1083 [Pontibacter akesuensis]